MEALQTIYEHADEQGAVGIAMLVSLYIVAFALLYASASRLKRLGAFIGGVLGTLILLMPLALLISVAVYVGDY